MGIDQGMSRRKFIEVAVMSGAALCSAVDSARPSAWPGLTEPSA
jgi:hypothetical protein